MATNDPATQVPLSPEELFDSIGPGYEIAFANLQPQHEAIEWILQQLQNRKPAKILDIGCGTGKPVCSSFADAGHDVLGIDVSGVMLSDARAKVTNANATFMKADAYQMEFPAQSFDAITVFFSLIASTTQDLIRRQIFKIYDWLRPGGVLVFASVPVSINEERVSFMGRLCVGSSLSAEEFLDCIGQAGFEVVQHSLSSFTPRGVEAGICEEGESVEEAHVFIYAKKQPLWWTDGSKFSYLSFLTIHYFIPGSSHILLAVWSLFSPCLPIHTEGRAPPRHQQPHQHSTPAYHIMNLTDSDMINNFWFFRGSLFHVILPQIFPHSYQTQHFVSGNSLFISLSGIFGGWNPCSTCNKYAWET